MTPDRLLNFYVPTSPLGGLQGLHVHKIREMLYRHWLLFLPSSVSSSTTFLSPHRLHLRDAIRAKGLCFRLEGLLSSLDLVSSFSALKVQFRRHSLRRLSKDHVPPSALVFPYYFDCISARLLCTLDWMRLSHLKLPILDHFRPIRTGILHDSSQLHFFIFLLLFPCPH